LTNFSFSLVTVLPQDAMVCPPLLSIEEVTFSVAQVAMVSKTPSPSESRRPSRPAV
jgi:hypothetical protein